jgi:hypothetical protein
MTDLKYFLKVYISLQCDAQTAGKKKSFKKGCLRRWVAIAQLV